MTKLTEYIMNKYKMFIAALAAVLSGNAVAQSVTVEQKAGLQPSGTDTLAISLKGLSKSAAAAQFDIKVPDGIKIKNDIAYGDLLNDGYTVDYKPLGNGVVRVFIYNTNKDEFAKPEGVLLNVPITTEDAKTEAGDYAGGSISNIKVANLDASKAAENFADAEFSVNVGYDVLGHLVSDPSEELDIRDLLKLARLIVEADETTDELLARGDMNKDAQLNVQDYVILSGEIFPSVEAKGNNFTPNAGGENILNAKGGQSIVLNLQNVNEFQAAQFDVTLPDGITMGDVVLASRANGLDVLSNKINDNTWRVLVASTDGTAIADNAGDLLQINLEGNGAGEATVSNVLFSDVHAQGTSFANMTVNVQSGNATGINGVEVDADNDANKTTYSLGGAIRKGLQRGVNIVRDAAGKVTKVIKK